MATADFSQTNMNGLQSSSRLGFRLENGSFIFFWDHTMKFNGKELTTRKMVMTDNKGGQLRTGFLHYPAINWKVPSSWSNEGSTNYEVLNFRGYTGGIRCSTTTVLPKAALTLLCAIYLGHLR